MSTLATVALMALGVHVAIRTIAALYRVRDLWYTIGTAYPRVLRGLLGWGGATAAIAWLLPGDLREAFWWGLLGYAAFYLSLFVIRYPLLRRRRAG